MKDALKKTTFQELADDWLHSDERNLEKVEFQEDTEEEDFENESIIEESEDDNIIEESEEESEEEVIEKDTNNEKKNMNKTIAAKCLLNVNRM